MRKCKTWIAALVALAASGSVAAAEQQPLVLDDKALDSVSAGLSNVNAYFSIGNFFVRGMSIGVQFAVQGTVADQSTFSPGGGFVPLNLARSAGTILVQNQGTSPSTINMTSTFGVSLN